MIFLLWKLLMTAAQSWSVGSEARDGWIWTYTLWANYLVYKTWTKVSVENKQPATKPDQKYMNISLHVMYTQG